jgi:hypothetical protein
MPVLTLESTANAVSQPPREYLAGFLLSGPVAYFGW